MRDEVIQEARRQAQICNACRYCEGYCAVFPALHRQRAFSDGDLTQLANLCHNCRGCYYACQYTDPHEFALNLPAALAELRHASWEECAWPRPLARVFHRSGVAVALAAILGFAVMFAAIQALPGDGAGFYAALSHTAMVAIFLPAFLLPLLSLWFGLRRYWQTIGGGTVQVADVFWALRSAATMRNLRGGHGDGCNFEEEDTFSHSRRHAHHAVMYGFFLCFAATSAGTVMHYVLGLHAPYAWYGLPKLLGVPGGILMMIGATGLGSLKLRANQDLGAVGVWGGEMGFTLLLFLVAASGLALYAVSGSGLVPGFLALHLGAVLAFFLLTPYSKMAHGFYRLAALIAEAGQNRDNRP